VGTPRAFRTDATARSDKQPVLCIVSAALWPHDRPSWPGGPWRRFCAHDRPWLRST
jgi:hypothetical protein